MSNITTVGLDLAKNVFQVHGADASGRAELRKKLRWDQVLVFFSHLQPSVVAMEACGGAHLWGREIGKLGHDVWLIPPVYVKPFVKRQKNDAADAEAICEATQRPTMRLVPAKGEETQGAGMVFRVRELLPRQRTQAINALRGHLTECGHIVPQGAANAAKLIASSRIRKAVCQPIPSERSRFWSQAAPIPRPRLVRLMPRSFVGRKQTKSPIG